MTANGGGVEELRQFQHFLNEYCITVFTDRRGKDTMFEGPVVTPDHPRKYIDLNLGDNHFNVITSVSSAFTVKTYCRTCKYADSNTGALRNAPPVFNPVSVMTLIVSSVMTVIGRSTASYVTSCTFFHLLAMNVSNFKNVHFLLKHLQFSAEKESP